MLFSVLPSSAWQKDSDSEDETKKETVKPNGGFTTYNGSFTTGSGGKVAKPKDKNETDNDRDRKRRHRYYEHDRYPATLSPVVLPIGFSTVIVASEVFYYNDGNFYKLEYSEALVPVQAPLNAVVDKVPLSSARLKVKGITYYVFNGIYFRKVDGGYLVVAPPV